MMTAEEAARKTEEVLNQFTTEQLKKIESGIRNSVMNGDRTYCYEGYLSPQAKNTLESYGYVVKPGSQYNQSYVVIKW